MFRESLNRFIDGLEQRMIENGMKKEDAIKEKSNLLKAIELTIEGEKKKTFHGLADEIRKNINPKNMQ